MAEHAHTTCRGQMPPLDTIDLDNHPDGALMRLCAGLERLRAITVELELIAASLPTNTPLGRRMKELSL